MTNRKLSEAEESALCAYLDALEHAGLHAPPYQISKTANSILVRSHTGPRPAPHVGEKWSDRFLQRYPEYHVRKQKSINIERKEAHHPDDIQVFFDRYKEIVSEKRIQACDLYNFDETGFRIGQGRHQKIITRDPKLNSYIESSTNRDFITLIETICGHGWTLPPMIIVSASRHLKSWYQI
jgi:hypothetical protein